MPRGIDLAKVRDFLGGLDGVSEVHDLHIWAMSTNETALTVHLVRPAGTDDKFLHHVCEELSYRFNIHHATLQIETFWRGLQARAGGTGIGWRNQGASERAPIGPTGSAPDYGFLQRCRSPRDAPAHGTASASFRSSA